MANFSEKYSKILKEIENNISDSKEREYVLSKVHEMSYLYMDLIDRVTKLDDTRIEILEERQDKAINLLSKLKDTVDLIKNDIYEEEGYDFEIVCPYCNYEFVADIEDELKEEIECPECHNIIELDWDGDDEEESFSGNHCAGCHGCDIRLNNKNEDSEEDEELDDESENQESDGKDETENSENIISDEEDYDDDNDDDM